MRELRFVRPFDDGTGMVVETDDGLEQFLLRDPTPAAEPAPVPTADRPETPAEIAPREIQVRIRAGESPQALAESLGVPVSRIERFAGPVMDERLRIADEARRARAHRSEPDPHTGESKLVLFGEAVDARFGAHGIVATEVSWDSRRRDDGGWIVTADWLGGSGRHGAEWLFQRSSRMVTPLDDTATDLLSERPIRPVMPTAPEPRVSLAAAPPLAPGVVAFPEMAAAVNHTQFADAHTGPMPHVDEPVFDQEQPYAPQHEVPPPLLPAGADDAMSGMGGLNFDAPALPLGITDPSTRPGSGLRNLTNFSAAKRGESEDEKAARARVPSWDDILLGVRRKDD